MPFRRRRYYPKHRRLGYGRRRTAGYTRRALPHARALTPTSGTWVPSFSTDTPVTWFTLAMNQLVLPAMSTLVGERRSSFIYLKGIKIDHVLANFNNYPIYVHFAILQDRDNNNNDLDREQNFFRDTTSLTARAHPFANWSSGAAFDRRQHMNNINGDHYKVITHERIKLGGFRPGLDNYPDQVSPIKNKRKYYKINRRIAFDNITDETNWRPFYICYWWQPESLFNYTSTQNNTFFTYQYKTDVVFKNIL